MLQFADLVRCRIRTLLKTKLSIGEATFQKERGMSLIK